MSPRTAPQDSSNPSWTAEKHRGWVRHLDIVVAAGLAIIAALATSLPPGVLRTAITLPVLLFVPGYLLIKTIRPASGRLLQDVLMGLGLSLPVVGLAALLTAALPGGFTRAAIIAVVTLACIAFAVVAALRRRSIPTQAATTAAVPSE